MPSNSFSCIENPRKVAIFLEQPIAASLPRLCLYVAQCGEFSKENTVMEKRLLRLPQVREAVGLSRSEIYRLIKLGRFPRNVPLGERVRAWDGDEIQAWVRERIASRDKKSAA